jgi:O-antigen/teichoic acid export membrane protein
MFSASLYAGRTTPILIAGSASTGAPHVSRYDRTNVLTDPTLPIDSPSTRAAERRRRLFLSVAAALAQRAVLMLTTFVALRLAFRALGNELFGVWATIVSFTATLSFADLGIGNGLLNLLAPRMRPEERAAARAAVSSAFWTLAGLAVVLEAVLIAAAPHASSSLFRDVHSPQVAAALLAFGTIFCASLPLGTAQRIYLAAQEAYAYSVWETLGAAASLLFVVAAIALGGSLPALVAAAVSAPFVTAISGSIALWRRRPWLLPSPKLVSGAVVRALMKMGFWFLTLQAAAAIAFSTDAIVAARELGAAAVSRYAVAARLFSYLTMLIAVVLTPLWPAFGEAKARGDVDWIRATLRRSIGLAVLITGAGSAVLVAGARPFIRWWIGEPAVPPVALLTGLAALTVLTGVISCYATLLNGVNALAFQGVCGAIMAAAALAAKIVFVRRWGVEGLPWGTFVAYAAVSAIPMHLYARRVLQAPDKIAGPHG